MELFNYLLKVSACSALFFAFYLLVLRKLTFFKINRFYLLASLLVSFIIPAMQFTIECLQNPMVLVDGIRYGSVVNDTNNTLKTSSNLIHNTENLDFLQLFSMLYGLIAAGLLGFASLKLVKLIRYTQLKTNEINGLKIVTKSIGFTNCSFFNYVFINENSLTNQELQILLCHEEVHAKELHSIDKIILMVLKSVLWFNPIIYLYDKMLEETHEFEADQRTSENFGAQSYAHLLLKLAVVKSDTSLVLFFVKSPLKQRIKMLFNSKSTNMKKLTYLLVVPVILCLIWGFTIKVVYAAPILTPTQQIKKIDSPIIATPVTTQKLAASKESKIKVVPKVQELVKTIINPPIQLEEDEPIYSRFPTINSKGEPCDMVKITIAGCCGASVEVRKDGKALIIINGVRYSEEEMKVMNKDKIANIKSISAVDGEVGKCYPDCVGKYDGVIELPAVDMELLNYLLKVNR